MEAGKPIEAEEHPWGLRADRARAAGLDASCRTCITRTWNSLRKFATAGFAQTAGASQ